MVTYTKPHQRNKEGARLRGERDQIKFIDLRFAHLLKFFFRFIL